MNPSQSQPQPAPHIAPLPLGGIPPKGEALAPFEKEEQTYEEYIEEFDLQRYVLILKRRWWVAGACGVLLMIPATMFSLWQQRIPQQYTAYGKILFQKQDTQSTLVGVGEGLDNLQTISRNPLVTELALLQSRSIIEAAIAKLGWVDATGQPISVSDFKRTLKVSQLTETDIIDVAFQSPNATQSADAVNALMEVYLESLTQVKRDEVAAARKFIEEQLPRLETQVAEATQALQDFKKNNQLTSTEQESALLNDRLNTLNQQIEDLQNQLVSVETQSRELRRQLAMDATTALNLTDITGAPGVQQVIGSLQDAQSQLAVQRTLYTSQHPTVVNLERQVAALEALLRQRVQELMRSQPDLALGLMATPGVATGGSPTGSQVVLPLSSNPIAIPSPTPLPLGSGAGGSGALNPALVPNLGANSSAGTPSNLATIPPSSSLVNPALGVGSSGLKPNPPGGTTAPGINPSDLYLGSLKQGLASDLVQAELTRSTLTSQLQQLQKLQRTYQDRAQKIPDLEVQEKQLRDRLALVEASYQQLRSRLPELVIVESQSVGQSQAQIIETAGVPPSIAPSFNMVYVIAGGVVGSFMGLGLVLFLELIDRSVKMIKDAEALTGFGALGAIPTFKTAGDRGGVALVSNDVSPRVVVVRSPESPICESYQIIQAALRLRGLGTRLRSVAVVSTVGQEGRSEIVANLAATLAQGRQRVLIVDGDLRSPQQHLLWKVPNDRGFSTLIDQEIPPTWENLQSFFLPLGSDLFLLPGGPLLANPLALIDSDYTQNLLDQLSQWFDCILMDTSPLVRVADGALLGQMVDSALWVVRTQFVDPSLVVMAKGLLNRSQTPVLGIVASQVDFQTEEAAYMHWNRRHVEQNAGNLLDGLLNLGGGDLISGTGSGSQPTGDLLVPPLAGPVGPGDAGAIEPGVPEPAAPVRKKRFGWWQPSPPTLSPASDPLSGGLLPEGLVYEGALLPSLALPQQPIDQPLGQAIEQPILEPGLAANLNTPAPDASNSTDLPGTSGPMPTTEASRWARAQEVANRRAAARAAQSALSPQAGIPEGSGLPPDREINPKSATIGDVGGGFRSPVGVDPMANPQSAGSDPQGSLFSVIPTAAIAPTPPTDPPINPPTDSPINSPTDSPINPDHSSLGEHGQAVTNLADSPEIPDGSMGDRNSHHDSPRDSHDESPSNGDGDRDNANGDRDGDRDRPMDDPSPSPSYSNPNGRTRTPLNGNYTDRPDGVLNKINSNPNGSISANNTDRPNSTYSNTNGNTSGNINSNNTDRPDSTYSNTNGNTNGNTSANTNGNTSDRPDSTYTNTNGNTSGNHTDRPDSTYSNTSGNHTDRPDSTYSNTNGNTKGNTNANTNGNTSDRSDSTYSNTNRNTNGNTSDLPVISNSNTNGHTSGNTSDRPVISNSNSNGTQTRAIEPEIILDDPPGLDPALLQALGLSPNTPAPLVPQPNPLPSSAPTLPRILQSLGKILTQGSRTLRALGQGFIRGCQQIWQATGQKILQKLGGRRS